MKVRIAITSLLLILAAVADSFAQEKKPNILVIMGDDIGWDNHTLSNRGGHGLLDTEHRSHWQRRGNVYLLVRPAELHCWSGSVYHGTIPNPYRPNESRTTRC